MNSSGSHGLRQIIPGNPETAITPEWLWLTCRRPALEPLDPTQPSTGTTLFRIVSLNWRAPLRNRTVDLLLTMHTCFVRWRPVGLDYCGSEGYLCPGTSRCVGHCLAALSLGLSLAPEIQSCLPEIRNEPMTQGTDSYRVATNSAPQD
jgi:hypothetical protein